MAGILVTGAAGFIGFHCARKLLERGESVLGIDNLNPYYDVKLKHDRRAILEESSAFRFLKLDLADREGMRELFSIERPTKVLHLAAQAGVRHSLTDPHAYVQSNVVGFLNVLEGCRAVPPVHLVYASSSSVYGLNARLPFSVRDGVDHPASLYAATKKSDELMAHAYSHLFGLPATGLRFFTVYGPWGRPDMALFSFTRAILEGRPIDVFNHGDMRRDFTYVDDVVEGVLRVLDRPPRADPSLAAVRLDPGRSTAPHRVYNIGNSQPVGLLRMIEVLEERLGKKAEKRLLPMAPGDVQATYADVGELEREFGFRPRTTIETGIARFVDWYLSYFGAN